MGELPAGASREGWRGRIRRSARPEKSHQRVNVSDERFDPLKIVEAFNRRDVEYVVQLGGYAAELHAAAVPPTRDIDFTPGATEEYRHLGPQRGLGGPVSTRTFDIADPCPVAAPGWSRLRRCAMDRSDQPADAAFVPVAAPLTARRGILRVAPRLNIRGHHAADSGQANSLGTGPHRWAELV